ncbi:Mur ligase family protein [Methanobrevibacter sp.]|uniref:Mur ligase family protein n=1 Tax=Methanobrevibacter sp. TaxID=66852 RepID=UPI0026E0749A|nr:Mur ligase family protein [Methanobrevibacter sp.]MDO5859431.1 Mur ligase family protein [Methanobrevibacter sp.]
MNYLVVGAGNASRPVARLLNYLGHKVIITDLKEMSSFKIEFQRSLKQMESEGVILDLNNQNPNLDGIEAVYMPPTLPASAPIAKLINDSDVKILTNEEFSKIVQELIPVDIIGITGTMGKTTTTFITTSIFKSAGYKVWSCSSLVNNLVSEAIIDGIVTEKSKNCDIAIFELPHGTIGLLNNLNVKIGLLTNIAEDHLSEFGGSVEKYRERKLILEKMSETVIANNSCFDIISPRRENALYYALDENVDFKGTVGDESLTIEYSGDSFTTPFYMMSYFFENSVGASAVALTYGIKKEDIIKALTNFKGLPAHMDNVGIYNGRKIILDSAFLYDGMKITLDYFKDDEVVLFLDHFDTLSVRDKSEVGQLVGQYDLKAVIASGFNEVTQEVEMEAAQEILDAIDNPDITKVAVETIEKAAELTFKYSKPGDIILHMGPLIAYDRLTTVDKIMKGLEKGSKKYECV